MEELRLFTKITLNRFTLRLMDLNLIYQTYWSTLISNKIISCQLNILSQTNRYKKCKLNLKNFKLLCQRTIPKILQ